MNKDNIKIDPEGRYEGYYWMSDATEPTVLGAYFSNNQEDKSRLPELLLTLNPGVNPFVVEAQLYDAEKKCSYSLKYIDGKYIINRYSVEEDLKNIESGKNERITLKKYYGNRMPGLRLRFLQYWREQPDNLCAGFDVLNPAELVFIGFEQTNKSEKS